MFFQRRHLYARAHDERRAGTFAIRSMLARAVAVSACLASQAYGEADEPLADIISGIQSRERRLGKCFFVEWETEERIVREALDRPKADSAVRDGTPDELHLRYRRFLAWNGKEWRIDVVGSRLRRDAPDGPFRTREEHFTHIQRNDGKAYEWSVPIAGGPGPGSHGQIFTNALDELDPQLNDVSTLALSFFIRPSQTFLFRAIRDGQFEVLPGI